ncbi:MAG: glycosyltransferase [Hyphomicrobiales bacterium]|nr:glycosyltransferase [Hyphomicrobiales bacterium]
MNAPSVTVLLPVYNGAALLGAAVDSILAQTFGDFELIVIDDGSSDDPESVVAARRDPRIRFHRHANRGLAGTLNVGLELARAPLIARQDHDDLSRPTRLARQVERFAREPDLVVLGAQADIHDESGPTGRRHRPVTTSGAIRMELNFSCPFVHPSVMMRREAVLDVGGYATEHDRQPEDFDLWSRLNGRGRMANLEDSLMIYVERSGSIMRTTSFEDRIRRRLTANLAAAAGLPLDDPDLAAIHAFARKEPPARGSRWSIGRMSAILRDVAEKIDRDEETDEATRRAEFWIARIRRRSLRRRFLTPLAGILGR